MRMCKDIEKGFEKLAEASNGCWDNVDAEEFVSDLRGVKDTNHEERIEDDR